MASRAVVEELRALGVVVASVVADNARNFQKGIAACAKTGFVVGNCCAHTLQLLLSDLGAMFQCQFDQMKEVEGFFQNRFGALLSLGHSFFLHIKACGTRCIRPFSRHHERDKARGTY